MTHRIEIENEIIAKIKDRISYLDNIDHQMCNISWEANINELLKSIIQGAEERCGCFDPGGNGHEIIGKFARDEIGSDLRKIFDNLDDKFKKFISETVAAEKHELEKLLSSIRNT